MAEVQACLDADRRTAESERLLLERFEGMERDAVRAWLALKPATTPSVLRQAFAARWFIENVATFDDDDHCAEYAARVMYPELSVEQIIKAGKRHVPQVNAILKTPILQHAKTLPQLPNFIGGASHIGATSNGVANDRTQTRL